MKVMNMVNTNIGREPVEDTGKIIVGTSIKSGILGIPVFTILPKSFLKLVLNVKHPDSNGGGNDKNGHMDKKKGSHSNGVEKNDNKNGNGQIGSHGTGPGLDFIHVPQRQTVTNNK